MPEIRDFFGGRGLLVVSDLEGKEGWALSSSHIDAGQEE